MNYGNVGSAKEQKRGGNELNKWGSTDDLQLKTALPWAGQDSQPWTNGGRRHLCSPRDEFDAGRGP